MTDQTAAYMPFLSSNDTISLLFIGEDFCPLT